MENLQIINEQEVLGKQFRIYGSIEEPLFLAKDVAEWIEHSNARMMLNAVDEDEKVVSNVYTLGGSQESWFLTEDGLYEVLMQSRKPIAKQFKKQVKEILRTIRKTGGYVADSEAVVQTYFGNLPDNQKALLKEVFNHMEAQQNKIAMLEPKAAFADSVGDADGCILVKDLAAIITQNGYPIGERRLYSWLRSHGYVCRRRGSERNKPVQKYLEMGLFKLTESVVPTPDTPAIKSTIKVTGKGQLYFVNRFKKIYGQQAASKEMPA